MDEMTSLPKRRRRMSPSLVRNISIVGAVTALLLAALFIAYIAGGAPAPSSSTGVTQAFTALPSVATPTPVPASFPSPEHTWGAASIHAVTLDPLRYTVQAVMPGGKGILAIDDWQPSTPTPTGSPNYPQPKIVLIDPATGNAQTIYTTKTWDVARAATDGRYIAWEGGFNATGGPGSSNITVGYLDTVTGKTTLLSNGTTNTLDSTAIYVTHGMLLLPSNRNAYGLYTVNLATGEARTYFSSPMELTFSWPYVLGVNIVYTGSGKPAPNAAPPAMLLNLATGAQTDLTSILGFSYYFSNHCAMDGSTIFLSQSTATANTARIMQLDHADLSNPAPHTLFTLTSVYPLQANSVRMDGDGRMLVIHNPLLSGNAGVWDRQKQVLIMLPTPAQLSSGNAEFLSNGMLAYWQQEGSAFQLMLVNEAAI
jgi:hypothetical protein